MYLHTKVTDRWCLVTSVHTVGKQEPSQHELENRNKAPEFHVTLAKSFNLSML